MNKYLEKIAEIEARGLEKQALEPLSMILGGVAAKKLGEMGAKKLAKGRVLGKGSAHHRRMTTQIEAGLRGGGEEARRGLGQRAVGTVFSHEKEHALTHARDIGTKARQAGAGGKPWAHQSFSERRNTAKALREHLGKNYSTFKHDRQALVQERQQAARKAVTTPPAKPRQSLSQLAAVEKSQKREGIKSFTENRFQPELGEKHRKTLGRAGTVADLATFSPVQAVERQGLAHHLPKGKARKIAETGLTAAGIGELGYHAYHGAHSLLHTPAVHEGLQAAARLFGG